jgi:hypothetical protein
VSSSRGAGDGSDRLSAAIRELQAQVTEDVLNLRARVLALEQQLEEMRGQAKAHPQARDEPPATKAGARGTTRRSPSTAAKAADAKDAKGSKGTQAKPTQAKSPKPKAPKAKSPRGTRSKT